MISLNIITFVFVKSTKIFENNEISNIVDKIELSDFKNKISFFDINCDVEIVFSEFNCEIEIIISAIINIIIIKSITILLKIRLIQLI